MSMGRTVDRPEPPRPVFETLPKAVCAAIRHGNDLAGINPDRWAETYGCTAEDVVAAWQKALTRIAPNSVEVEGK